MSYQPLPIKNIITEDPWAELKHFTAARIALGRTGISIPLKECLQFKLAHAFARDAVYSVLQTEVLTQQLQQFQLPVLQLQSQCTDRNQYLQRPDLGRLLNKASQQQIEETPATEGDIAIIICDGLSATAVNSHAFSLLSLLMPLFNQSSYSIAPITLVQQGRVAIGDEVGSLLKAKMSIVLIGERPGLSSPDSMGAYITYAPQKGLTDERRNCISNIRPEGLDFTSAANKIFYLISEALRLQLSGVGLKDHAGLIG